MSCELHGARIGVSAVAPRAETRCAATDCPIVRSFSRALRLQLARFLKHAQYVLAEDLPDCFFTVATCQKTLGDPGELCRVLE